MNKVLTLNEYMGSLRSRTTDTIKEGRILKKIKQKHWELTQVNMRTLGNFIQ